MLIQLPQSRLIQSEYEIGLKNAELLYKERGFKYVFEYYNDKAIYINISPRLVSISYWQGYYDFLQDRITQSQHKFVTKSIGDLAEIILKLMKNSWRIVNQEKDGLTIKTRFYKGNRVAIIDWQRNCFFVMRTI